MESTLTESSETTVRDFIRSTTNKHHRAPKLIKYMGDSHRHSLILFYLNMGFLDFLKGIGNFVKSGIQKVAGFVGKIAPVVSKVAGIIPLTQTQGIAAAANMVGQVANTLNGTDPSAAQTPAGTAPAAAPDAQAQAQAPAGTAPAAGPIM
jgi:hypothetical protein